MTDLEKLFKVKSFVNKLRFLQLRDKQIEAMDTMYTPFIIEKMKSDEYMGSYEYIQDITNDFWEYIKDFQKQIECEFLRRYRNDLT